jgi:hypothetical protein
MAEIETLMLANHAEAVNGLLYVSGGGWTDLWLGERPEGQTPPGYHVGVAISVLIGWNETNRRHHLVLRLEGEDGPEVARIEADITAGRAPHARPGSDGRAVLAMNAEVPFPAPGGYRMVAELGDQVVTRSFTVHHRSRPGGS